MKGVKSSYIIEYYPIKMTPIFKEYLWGGNKLIKEWKKHCTYETAAESWELSAHKNGQSIAANGALIGKSLDEIVEIYGKHCLGTHPKKRIISLS